MRFFPFKLLHKSYWADAKDSALASQEASNNSLSTVVKMMGDERHSESQSWETICSFDHKPPWRTAGRVVRPTKKELNAARRAGHLAYLQESIQANASEGSGDEAAPDLPRPTTADEPTEVPTQAPAKRNRTPATSTSEAGSTLGPAKRPTRKTHKTTNLNLRQLSQQSVTRKPDHTSSSSEATDVEMSESSSA
ncbi:hypothetical protein A1F94_003784 [Pyrenophora tritici-repentis]|nr:hypothetical protein A1F94_003784 [Pyrenophora tritici-repentis]